jgi:hypothetical protein
MGGSEAARESILSGGDCANGCADGEAGSGVLCKDGRNRAHTPSKPALIIPARIRRRFTRSSKIGPAILPCGRRYRILPRNGGKKRVVVAGSSRERGEISRRRSSLSLVAEETGSVVRWKFKLTITRPSHWVTLREEERKGDWPCKLLNRVRLQLLAENLTNMHSTCILRPELGLEREN